MAASNETKVPSLEDPITMPDTKEVTSSAAKDEITKPTSSEGMNVTAPSFVPGQLGSWADEANSPLDANPPAADPAKGKEPDDDLAKAQTDGAGEAFNGTPGIYEPTRYSVDVKLNDMQADPNNPLYSVKSFEDLNLDPNLIKGLTQMRFVKPSKIQEKALPLLIMNPPRNMIGQSQSGTGKTAAFVLNALMRTDFTGEPRPQVLVLAPTRELARQIMGVFQVMGQFLDNVHVAASIPMDAASKNKRVNAQIIVGTPGTTMDLVRRRLLEPSEIKVLVLDEADNMIGMQGLGDQCLKVKQLLPKNIQIVLFSATFPDNVVDYAMRFAPNANQITLKHEELTVEGIRQLYLDCNSEEEKFENLVKLYGMMTIGSSIIFVKTRVSAIEIQRRLEREGHQVACLTGEFEGFQRDMIIDAFRDGKAKVLITTNVLARGIDVQTVSLVINYDVPLDANRKPDPQTYLHRIGRTGRFGRVGVSISLISGHRDFQALKEIAEYFRIILQRLDSSDWDRIETNIQKVLKSSRAGANFQQEMPKPENMQGRDQDMIDDVF